MGEILTPKMLLKNKLKRRVRQTQENIYNKILEQWKWMKIVLTMILIEIIIVCGVIIYTLLSQSHTVVITAQASEVISQNSPSGDVASNPSDENAVSNAGISLGNISYGATVEDLIVKYFGSESETAIKLFQAESGLNPNNESWCDKTADGHSFSIGLTQINLTQHKLGEVDSTKAYKGKNYEAIVIDEGLYSKCVKLAKDPKVNLTQAKKIYDSRGFTAWGAYNKLTQ